MQMTVPFYPAISNLEPKWLRNRRFLHTLQAGTYVWNLECFLLQLLQQFLLAVGQLLRDFNMNHRVEVALVRHTETLQADLVARLDSGLDLDPLFLVQRWYRDRGAEVPRQAPVNGIETLT